MTQIFISHCTEDAPFAQQIARGLADSGVDVWIAPNNILPGEEFVDSIQRGLDSSTHFVVILSEDALKSSWVKLEMSTAIRLERDGKMLVAPILYRECSPPLLLGAYQWIDHKDDSSKAIHDLLVWLGRDRPGGWSKPAEISEDEARARTHTLNQIAEEVATCTACSLHLERMLPVSGTGPANARIMFIGEAPGPEDDQTGQPFVSAAGEFLDELLEMIALPRENVFMTNIVKCRPNENRVLLSRR